TAKAYRALPAYVDHGAFRLTLRASSDKAGGRKDMQVEQRLDLTIVRPNKLALRNGSFLLVSDGEKLTAVLLSTGAYAETAAPAKLILESFTRGSLRDMLFSGPSRCADQ